MMFCKRNKDGRITILIMCVDDTILNGNDIYKTESLKTKLAIEFEIKNLSNLRYFLGIKVTRSKQGIFISQRKYVINLLKETYMLGSKPKGLPINANHFDPNTLKTSK